MTLVGICPMKRATTATITSMMFIGFESWARAIDQTLGGGS